MGLFKIQLFQEVHKNLGNLPHGFDIVYFSKRQFHEEYLANLCGLLRKAELYLRMKVSEKEHPLLIEILNCLFRSLRLQITLARLNI